MDALINYFIRKYPYNFISGTDDCNIVIIRNNKVQPKKFILLVVVGVTYHPTGCNVFDMHNYINNKLEVDVRFKQLHTLARHIHDKNQTEIQIIGYPALPEYAENNWAGSEKAHPFGETRFYMHGDGSNSKMVSGYELREYIYNAIQCVEKDEGTSKEQNSHISGYMQYWNRNFLSSSLSIVDIDGVFYNWKKEMAVLLEVKRSNYEPWSPFLKDCANYMLYCSLSQNINSGSYYLLMQHHEEEKSGAMLCDDDYQIKFYCVTGVDTEEYWKLKNAGKINGNYLLRKKEHCLGQTLTLAEVCQKIESVFL